MNSIERIKYLTESVWLPIRDFPLYFINKDGIVRNKHSRILSSEINSSGYARVSLYKHGKKEKRFIHRLVLETFNPNPESSTLDAHHIDSNIKNNSLSNLQWCTHSENCHFKYFKYYH